MDSFDELWELVREECKKQVSESIYNVWFKDLELVCFDDNKVVLALSEFKKKIVENRFMDKLKLCFNNVLGFDIDIEIIDSTKSKSSKNEEEYVLKYAEDTFETFVVGSSNKFAHAAALAVATNPGGAYNPLFIHGNSGLGKTHLLNAICHEIKKNFPDMNIVYTRGEDFTNELVNYIAQKNMQGFHEKYRSADILLVDDIQFIAGKDSTQEEFFHTFNTLTQSGSQIVLASDRPPKEIATLEDRLRNRFEWGLIADIQPPDIETRMAIIKRKAEMLSFDISDEVIEYIADKLKDNIRQLEGAVKKMQAFVTMQGLPSNISTAQFAIRDIMVDSHPSPVTVDKIVQEVARTYGVSPEDIRSKKQDARTVEMRQMSMHIVREMTGMSTNAIGHEFGGKNHTTVMYSLSQFDEKLQKRNDLRTRVENIIKNVNERH